MKRYLLLLALFLGTLTCVVAAQELSADTPSSREDILKLFDVMHLHEQMKLVMDQVSQQMRSISHEQLRKRDPNITSAEIAKLDSMADQLIKEMPISEMLDDMIPVYQKHLTKSDVGAMIGFYSTPSGQKILREMPAMTAEGMQAIQPRLRKEMDQAMEKIDNMASEEEEKQRSAPPAKKN